MAALRKQLDSLGKKVSNFVKCSPRKCFFARGIAKRGKRFASSLRAYLNCRLSILFLSLAYRILRIRESSNICPSIKWFESLTKPTPPTMCILIAIIISKMQERANHRHRRKWVSFLSTLYHLQIKLYPKK